MEGIIERKEEMIFPIIFDGSCTMGILQNIHVHIRDEATCIIQTNWGYYWKDDTFVSQKKALKQLDLSLLLF